MKPQDMVFIIVSIVFLLSCWKKPRVFVVLGLLCLAASIPLFTFWIFFTAQRLVYYSAGFMLVGIILLLIQERGKK